MEVLSNPSVSLCQARRTEVVRVPVKTILYLQAMAENGREDRPKSLGPALPWGHVYYQE
ncbi:MAG: hypothetical protein VKO39_03290 [Cyanobacteriota bacterium]|nr:hypothetical protein [Cyanobacteriota bacterium]